MYIKYLDTKLVMQTLIMKGYNPDKLGIIKFQRMHGLKPNGRLNLHTRYMILNSVY